MISSRRARVILAALIALCALFVYNYATRLMELASVEAEVVALQAQVDDERVRQARLQAERAALADPAFLDRVAREDLDLTMPGDTVVVVLDDTPVAPIVDTARVDAIAIAPGTSVEPVWRQWVDFFAADFAVIGE